MCGPPLRIPPAADCACSLDQSGNDTTGAPPIGADGSAASSGALLLKLFKEAMSDNASSACPELMATNQNADPAGTMQPVGLHTVKVYRLPPPLNGTGGNGSSLRNTNSADALGLLAVLHDAAADGLAALAVGETLTEASVTINQLFGELTLCAQVGLSALGDFIGNQLMGGRTFTGSRPGRPDLTSCRTTRAGPSAARRSGAACARTTLERRCHALATDTVRRPQNPTTMHCGCPGGA